MAAQGFNRIGRLLSPLLVTLLAACVATPSPLGTSRACAEGTYAVCTVGYATRLEAAAAAAARSCACTTLAAN